MGDDGQRDAEWDLVCVIGTDHIDHVHVTSILVVLVSFSVSYWMYLCHIVCHIAHVHVTIILIIFMSHSLCHIGCTCVILPIIFVHVQMTFTIILTMFMSH